MGDADQTTPSSETLRYEKPSLGRDPGGGRLQADLDRLLLDKAMERSDAARNLAQVLDESAALPLSVDIDRAFLGAMDAASLDVAQMLDFDHIGEMAVEGVRLNDLLDRGGASAEERKIVRRGLSLLKRKLYAQAIEWWELNRLQGHAPRLDGVLKLLSAVTYQLTGDDETARVIFEEVRRTGTLGSAPD